MEYFTLNNYIGTDPSDKETIWQSTEGYWPDPYTNPLYDVIGAPVLGNAQLTIVIVLFSIRTFSIQFISIGFQLFQTVFVDCVSPFPKIFAAIVVSAGCE